MNVSHLEFFCAVARYGSINKAAQALYISQPHLSHIIRDLEEDVGMALIERSKQGVTLTPEGERFLEHAQVVLQEMENLKRLSRRSTQNQDRLSVSMTKFSHTMESFNDVCIRNQQARRFSYTLNEGTVMDVVKDVAGGLTDVGVIHVDREAEKRLRTMLEERRIAFAPIADLTPHIVISRSHPLVQRGAEVTLEALQDYGFVRYSGQYEDFIYNISTENQSLDLNGSSRIIYVYGRAALLHLIANSSFYTIGIQSFLTQDSMYQILSVPIANCTGRLRFGIVTRQGAPLTEPEQEFITDVTARYGRLQAMEAAERGDRS